MRPGPGRLFIAAALGEPPDSVWRWLVCAACGHRGVLVSATSGGYLVEHPGRGFPCRVRFEVCS